MKKKAVLKNLFIISVLLAPALVYAKINIKGNGKIITRQIPVEEYDQIKISGHEETGFNSFWNRKTKPVLNYKQSQGTAFLEITTDENLFDILNIRQEGTRLAIHMAGRDTVIKPSRFIINGRSANLKTMDSNGYMDFRIDNSFATDSIHINMSGVGDVTIAAIRCDYIVYTCDGVGTLNIKGNAEQAKYTLNGVGKVKAYDCEVKDLTSSLSGVGSMQVKAINKLSANLSGVGSIKFLGNPSVLNQQNGGVGRIRKVN